MKNLVSKIRLILSTLLVIVFYNFESAESIPDKGQSHLENPPSNMVPAGISDPLNHANERVVLIQESSMNHLAHELDVKSDTAQVIALPAVQSESGMPIYTQKLTFAVISSILIFFFLSLALFSTRFMRDDEHKQADSLKTISFLRVSVFILFFLAIISVPASYGLHGFVAKASVSLFLICLMAGIALLFHIFLKKVNASFPVKSNSPGALLLDKSFPLLTILAAFYICIPAWTNLHFAELPVEFVTIYMIVAMVHVGRKTNTSSLMQCTFIKQVFNS